MISVKKAVYLNSFTGCYNNVVVLNKEPNGELKNSVKAISFKRLSPFKTFDCCNEFSKCQYVFVDKYGDLMNINEIDRIVDIIINSGYEIDYELTKIMKKGKTADGDLFFYITKTV